MRVARGALVPTLMLLLCLLTLCCLASFLSSLRCIAAILLFSLSLFPLYMKPHPHKLTKTIKPPRPARTEPLLSVILVGQVEPAGGSDGRVETTNMK